MWPRDLIDMNDESPMTDVYMLTSVFLHFIPINDDYENAELYMIRILPFSLTNSVSGTSLTTIRFENSGHRTLFEF